MKEVCRTCTFYSRIDRKSGKCDRGHFLTKPTDTCFRWDEAYKHIGGSMEFNFTSTRSINNCNNCIRNGKFLCKLFKIKTSKRKVCDLWEESKKCENCGHLHEITLYCSERMRQVRDTAAWCIKYIKRKEEEDDYFILS